MKSILAELRLILPRTRSRRGRSSQIRHIHRHSTYEIFFVMDGTFSVATEHGVREYERCAVIVPPDYDHYTVSKVTRGYCFYFTLSQAESSCDPRFFRIEKMLSEEIATLALDEELQFYVEHFAKRTDVGGVGEELTHLLFLLFHHLFEKLDPQPKERVNDTAKSKPNKYIHRIDAYIVGKKGGRQPRGIGTDALSLPKAGVPYYSEGIRVLLSRAFEEAQVYDRMYAAEVHGSARFSNRIRGRIHVRKLLFRAVQGHVRHYSLAIQTAK